MKPEELQDKITQEVMDSMEAFIRDRIAWAYSAGFNEGCRARGGLMAKKVIQMDLNGKAIKEWDSIAEAARAVGTKDSSIIKVCKGRLETTAKFRWKYSE